MKYNLFKVKIRDKNGKYNEIYELLKLSVGNNITEINYNKNKIKSTNQSFDIIVSCDKKKIKKNNGKMIYEAKNSNEIKILNKVFISNNMKRSKIIINNKQNELKEIVRINKQSVKIKINFLDNPIYLNSMFKDCKLLSGVYNFKNFNTKYLKAMCYLFEG